MTLSTVDSDGQPDARMVLVRGADARGFAFYTNYDSVKSRQLEAHPVAAATFGWLDLHRQVQGAGRDRARRPGRERRLLRVPTAREPDRGVGVAPVAADRVARPNSTPVSPRSRPGSTTSRCPRPPYWGGWRLTADRLGVLARPDQPPPRPPGIPPAGKAGRSSASPREDSECLAPSAA